MGKIETDNLISVSELSAVRTIIGAKSATDQAIRNQVNQLDRGERTPEQVGFEVVRPTKAAFFLRITDTKMEDFRKELLAFAEKRAPKLK